MELPGPHGVLLDHTVQIDAGRDDGQAELYVDGRQQATAKMPASFPVPGGVIDVAIFLYGVKRMHLVGDDGTERRLAPVPGTLEHRRSRLHRRRPRVSRAVGGLAIVILVVNLVIAVPAGLEIITTHFDGIAQLVGVFRSPIQLGLAQHRPARRRRPRRRGAGAHVAPKPPIGHRDDMDERVTVVGGGEETCKKYKRRQQLAEVKPGDGEHAPGMVPLRRSPRDPLPGVLVRSP